MLKCKQSDTSRLCMRYHALERFRSHFGSSRFITASISLLSMVKSAKSSEKKHLQVVRKRPAEATGQQQQQQQQQQQRAPSSRASPVPAKEAALPDWYGEANGELQNEVFLVTAAKLVNEKDRAENALEVKLPPLRDPATLSKLEFRTALQDSLMFTVPLCETILVQFVASCS